MQKSHITQTAMTDLPQEECTVWILAPDSNETGHYVMHKTRDWGNGEEMPVKLFFSRYPQGKFKVLAFSPYMLFNEKGLGMVDTSAPKTTDDAPDLKCLKIGTTMNRVVHNCATVQEALKTLDGFTKDGVTNPRHENYMLCDAHDAAIVELSPRHIACRHVANGFAVHTNHHILQEMLSLSQGKLEGLIKSATRMMITQDALAKSYQAHGKITLEDTLALSRCQDKENYPDTCPFRDSSVCAVDYIPEGDSPDLLGTLRICPGPPRYTIAIPVSMGITDIPAVLRNGDFGKRSYEIKRKYLDDDTILVRFQEMEQRFWKNYLDTIAQAKELLALKQPEAFRMMVQSLLDKQVAEAYALLENLLND